MADRSPASRFPRQGMDSVRDRRAGANFLDERVAGPGLKWVDGQLTLDIGRKQPIRLDRNGEVVFEFDPETMEVVPGSPFRVRAKVTPAVLASVQAESARLAAENSALSAANAALRVRVETLEASGTTLSSTVVDIDARLQLLEAVMP